MLNIQKTAENYYSRAVKNNSKDYIKRPSWLNQFQDKLAFFFFRQGKILTEGKVMPSVLVLVNDKMYKRKSIFYSKDHPAYFLYSDDVYYTENPDELVKLGAIRELRNGEALKTDENKVKKWLNGGLDRPIRKLLPSTLTEGRKVYLTTVLMCRNHLPKGKADREFFPLLVIDDKDSDAMVLPERYWCEE